MRAASWGSRPWHRWPMSIDIGRVDAALCPVRRALSSGAFRAGTSVRRSVSATGCEGERTGIPAGSRRAVALDHSLSDTSAMNGNLPRPSTIEVDHLGVSVRDLGRSLDFYCRILGAVLVMPPRPVDDFNFRRAVVTFDGSMVIDLNEHVTNSGEAFDPTR